MPPIPMSSGEEWRMLSAVILADLALLLLFAVVYFGRFVPDRHWLALGVLIPGIYLTIRAAQEINRYPSATGFRGRER